MLIPLHAHRRATCSRATLAPPRRRSKETRYPRLRVIEAALGGALDRVSDVTVRSTLSQLGYVCFGVDSLLQVRKAPTFFE